MKSLLFKLLLFLGSSALGILAAKLIIADFNVSPLGFVVVVVVFATAQLILSPLVAQLVARHARELLGGVGLISTFVALMIANLFSGSLTISGPTTWIVATLVIWLVTALATWFLPPLLRKYLKVDSE